MVIRVSGTVSIGPQGGPIQNPTKLPGATGGPATITQTGNDTSIGGDKIGFSATQIISYSTKNVGSVDSPSGSQQVDIDQSLSTTAERKLASAYFNGGVGIEQDLSVGGFIYGRIAYASSSTTSSNLVVKSTQSGVLALTMVRIEQVDKKSGTPMYANTVSEAMANQIVTPGGLTYQPFDGLLNVENVNVFSGQQSNSPINGAFTVTGGVGISGDVYIGGGGTKAGGGVIPVQANTGTIGIAGQEWATAYMNNIYSKFLGNTLTDIVLSPKNGVNLPTGSNGDNVIGGGYVDVFGELRVRGNNPIGTAPVVTNMLYVTMDGDDTNDGGAMDSSRACRTVSGAVKSPLYKSGTQIRVSAGHYLENNPIRLKPYTSIMGSDIRTTGIEPINKTQDLFHVDSGCYIAFCQFLNGRSGLLPGNDYINGTNRGAYCTAFPPLTGNDRIDLFHSPYIQNCTNMSGPWLKDGSMFVPDETIQIPIAVGTGSWTYNTTTVIVKISNMPINGFINAGLPGTSSTQYTGALSSTLAFRGTVTNSNSLTNIVNPSLYDSYKTADTGNIWVYTNATSLSLGQSVSSGQQNQSFFNARTLLLANKPFMQSQVVSYIDKIFNSGSAFVDPSSSTCVRDVGLIIDVIGQDMLYGTTSDSTFSGLQYWSQDQGFTGQISSEITATKAAIFSSLQPLVSGYATHSASTVNTLFGYINTILTNGPTGVTNTITVGGLPTANVNTLADISSLQANKAAMQAQVVAYVSATYPSLVYNTSTCYRDVGYIIDSICSDLATGGNLQSIKSGIYYYAYDSGSTVLSGTNEKIATSAAYSYIQSIIPSIVSGNIIASPYQSVVKQVPTNTPGTAAEINTLQSNIAVITDIIEGGPLVASSKTPQALTLYPDANAVNAWTVLHANRAFIQAEVTAYIQSVFSGTFEYNRQKSYRDAGILVENVAYDVAFGGNEKAIESGLAYWNGVVSYIATEMPQCIAAINYLNALCQAVVLNVPAPVLPAVAGIPVGKQVINTVMTDGTIARSSINNAFSTIINITKNGPSYAPPLYTSTGPDSAYASAEILLQANRTFIQEQTINYINYNLANPRPSLPYNKVKCERDTGIIIDSLATDLLFPVGSNSQSTFAGLQYYNQAGYVGQIPREISTTTAAIQYLQTIATKVIKNVTAAQDAIVGVQRYTTGTQITYIQPGTNDEVGKLNEEFGIILSILGGNTLGWTDKVLNSRGIASPLKSVQDSYALLQANKTYMQNEVLAYITSSSGLNYPSSSFSTSTCVRDMGYIIDSVCFDLLYGGNRQAVQSGLSYYVQNANSIVIPNEIGATIDAFTFLGNAINALVSGSYPSPGRQTLVQPVLTLPFAMSSTVTNFITQAVSTITSIISNGPSSPYGIYSYTPINLAISTSTDVSKAYRIIEANRSFLVAETLAYLDQTYNPGAFSYNQDLCYRDTGLLVDAVSQDILLGGNQKSIEAGLSYWNQGYNYVTTQLTTITQAISYIADISKKIIANTTVTSVTGTVATQVINPYFQYGNNYMPQQSVARNFGIISTIINKGPTAAPSVYAGGGLFALTGINGLDVQISPTVTYISTLSTGTYLVGLSTATVGFGDNATLYFGNTLIFPLQDNQVETLSLQQTGSTSSWDSRKVDAIGGMGGSLVDGAVVSDRSPIQSFVYDAFTQLTQGGHGVKVTNNGYAQLVSVFTIFASVGVQVDNGGIASIVNSNANFGDICLLAKGYGTRKFSGTVFNPPNRSYPFSPGANGLDQYYPAGFWPNLGGSVEIFVPDTANRPHISLVMEVVPPDNYQNLLNSPQLAANGVVLNGFLNAQPSISNLTTGSINLVGVDTSNVYVGNQVTILDQFGFPYDSFPYMHDEFGNYVDSAGNLTSTSSNYVPNPTYRVWYCQTGTVVTDVNFNSITLNQALTSGGGFPDNSNYFTIYFTGNSYYTVQTSVIAPQPYKANTNILSTNTDANYQGPAVSQITQHAVTLKYLNSLTLKVIANTPISKTTGNTGTQYINGTLTGGSGATSFINLEYKYMTTIITATNINAALSVVPSNLITQTGPVPSGAGSAITLIKNNQKFLAQEVYSWVAQQYPGLLNGSTGTVQQAKCYRDVELILQQLIYDLQTGGNYNAVYSGLSYWSRQGTYHIVTLGEAVTDPSLFPDGAITNFYQRSYISASGYVFEYVGAGSNYGALPQFGIADPVQGRETVQLNSGKVFFTSTDQNGDFRIGPGLVISQATGVISGRTFTQSLFANMTPFILAIEAG
jgi:hypothetical protein